LSAQNIVYARNSEADNGRRLRCCHPRYHSPKFRLQFSNVGINLPDVNLIAG